MTGLFWIRAWIWKTYEQNLTTIKYMDDLKKLGYPLLLGTSRKSVIGLTLDTPVTDRAVGTAVTTVFAVQQGYAFVRVHDIKLINRLFR